LRENLSDVKTASLTIKRSWISNDGTDEKEAKEAAEKQMSAASKRLISQMVNAFK
jgi:hypothetical protein